MSESTLDPAFAIPSDFVFGEVPSGATFAAKRGHRGRGRRAGRRAGPGNRLAGPARCFHRYVRGPRLQHHLPAGQREDADEIAAPRSITVKATQIQYSQKVLLNFNGLT
jgi:hypothetical protein